MKKLMKIINTDLFYLVMLPLWIPMRIRWLWRRRICKQKGCLLEVLYQEKVQHTVYCKRCQAYMSYNHEQSDYPIIKKDNETNE